MLALYRLGFLSCVPVYARRCSTCANANMYAGTKATSSGYLRSEGLCCLRNNLLKALSELYRRIGLPKDLSERT